jgi:putative oxidoreductase
MGDTSMDQARGLLALAGRALIVGIFLVSVVFNKIPNYSVVADNMGGKGVPAPTIMLGLAIVFMVLGSVSVMVGFKARIGALLLLIFLVLATYYFHHFWNPPPRDTLPNWKAEQLTHFLKNASLIGTMLFLIANGSGPGSLDELLARRRLAE